ncbi:RagB/SusD family nutrient uptake outer membrane protein [Mucilaginibacter calamicampi]|uniref:RagB/SusD family nutrient uptake outer membrane protein n=1 Tax=Mucilaginibacter calamicampi TaxID=1302352 RepID=A0ABW2YY17_9SPHI
MKIFKKTGIILASAAIIGTVSSCKKLLVEEPRDQLYPNYFSTAGGIAAGVTGVYSDLRDYYQGDRADFWLGTDEAILGELGSGVGNNNQMVDWNGLTSSNGPGFGGLWSDINTLNGVLQYAEASTQLTAVQKAQYINQARFLRAFIYFRLVQQYGGKTATQPGGIPLHTTFITEATTADAPANAADIYNQIIKDLNDAITGLPAKVDASSPFSAAGVGKTGTVGVAKALLAKVYLTRGYLSEIAQPGDFQKAADLCADVITNKVTYGFDLWQDYADEHKVENDYGKENMFAVDYGLGGADAQYTAYNQGPSGGYGINLLYVIWRWNYIGSAGIDNVGGIDNIPQTVNTSKQPMVRDNYNGRPYARVAPNGPYIYRLWPAGQYPDSRFDATFQTFWICNKTLAAGTTSTGGSKGVLTKTSNFSETSYNIPVDGDTAILIAPGDVTMARRDAFKGLIIEPLQVNNIRWPTVKKFDDTRRIRLNDFSARPIILMRFSEVYLMQAEANYMAGNTAAAITALNVLRTRAAYRVPADGDRIPKSNFRVTSANMAAANAANALAMQLSATEIAQMGVAYSNTVGSPLNGMDIILDEYSKELFGDQRRWEDLSRTRQLVRRVKMYRPGSLAATNVKDDYMRRAIPQDLINAVLTGPKYPQNNGY